MRWCHLYILYYFIFCDHQFFADVQKIRCELNNEQQISSSLMEKIKDLEKTQQSQEQVRGVTTEPRTGQGGYHRAENRSGGHHRAENRSGGSPQSREQVRGVTTELRTGQGGHYRTENRSGGQHRAENRSGGVTTEPRTGQGGYHRAENRSAGLLRS